MEVLKTVLLLVVLIMKIQVSNRAALGTQPAVKEPANRRLLSPHHQNGESRCAFFVIACGAASNNSILRPPILCGVSGQGSDLESRPHLDPDQSPHRSDRRVARK